ncbi:hypothetical protein [Chlamydia psittaci]
MFSNNLELGIYIFICSRTRA